MLKDVRGVTLTLKKAFWSTKYTKRHEIYIITDQLQITKWVVPRCYIILLFLFVYFSADARKILLCSVEIRVILNEMKDLLLILIVTTAKSRSFVPQDDTFLATKFF